jgi:hypothetical protein
LPEASKKTKASKNFYDYPPNGAKQEPLLILLKNPSGGADSLLSNLLTRHFRLIWGALPVEILVVRGFSAESIVEI